jgi:diaminohydroxyphosphoribosylaminopyrimidine deaminase/5-amino-6-(5-phosphoribosylamino)uracil reductase
VSRRVEDNQFGTHRASELMRRALGLTEGTQPHPNPRVGALVITSAGEIVAERAHLSAGTAHAEAAALLDAGPAARGSTLVVTLEPCAHHGRTPPCTDAIITSGVARVIVGALDPDPRVSGRGIAALRSAGIDVLADTDADAIRANDPAYFHHRETGRPLVTLKAASTLDGQSAAADRTSQWITDLPARMDGHRLRSEHDAALVGIGTIIDDDPLLNVRLPGYNGRHPRPVVVTGRRTVPDGAAILTRDPLLITGGAPQPSYLDAFDQAALPGPDGVDLIATIEHLATEGILSVLVEGGPRLAGSALRAGIVDRLVIYYGAMLGGGVGLPSVAGGFATLTDHYPVAIDAIATIGPDFRVDATMKRGT